ncbi:PaaI family thioesterase [bacterium]|nr:PaaI family thioesterase [bacterium]
MPKYSTCFVCGNENKHGLNLTFYETEDNVRSEFRPEAHWCGYPNIVHGGIISAIFDEGLGWAGYPDFREYYLTLEISVRFIKQMTLNKDYIFTGRIVKSRGNYYFSEGEIRDSDGTLYASGKGKYIVKTDIKID